MKISRRVVLGKITCGTATVAAVLVSVGCDDKTQPPIGPTPPASPPVLSLSLSAPTIQGGQAVDGTVTLANVSSGTAVALSSSNSQAATVPSTVAITSGATSATFRVTTSEVAADAAVTITASYAGPPPLTQTATLTVTAPPPPPGFVVLDASSALAAGFDIFVNTDRGLTSWLTRTGDEMQAAYPTDQLFGFVAIVLAGNSNLGSRPSRDMSSYRTLQVQMRGAVGGETFDVGIKDNTDPDDGSETKRTITVSSSWQTYSFTLADFRTADLRRLYLLFEIVFNGRNGRTVFFKDVRYLP